MQSVLNILQKNGLLAQTTVQKNQVVVFEKRPDTQIKSIERERYSAKCSAQVNKDTVAETNKQLEVLPFPVILTQSFGVGDKMSEYKNFHKVFAEQQCDLVHKEGEVLLVDVWATWCGPCQNPMKHNQEMLEKNEDKWKDRVRIVAVSVDDQKQTIVQRVNSKGWNKIEHLTLLGWDGEHQLIQNFQIQGIPFVFLVDKEGSINYVGHPSGVKLEERINQLLQKQPSKPEQKNQQNAQPALINNVVESLQKIAPLTKLFNKEFLQQQFGKAELFFLQSKIDISIVNGKIQNSKATIIIFTSSETPQLIQQFKAHLKDVDPSLYELKQNLVQYQSIPNIQNSECVQCKSKLNYPLYWCKWDENPSSFRCRSCVQKKSTEQGKHFSYLQNSVLLTGPWKKIEKKKFGSNIQPKSVIQVDSPHGFGCNGTCGQGGGQIGNARYICLGCRPEPNMRGDHIDFCENCMSKYLADPQPFKEALQQQNHCQDHPWLRILYNVEGYYKF